jgi:hypothetical protein
MDAEEVQNISALVDQSSKVDESFGQFFDGAARDSTTIFSHTSMCPAHAASGVNCNCTFSRMNFNDGCCSTVRTWRPGRKVTSYDIERARKSCTVQHSFVLWHCHSINIHKIRSPRWTSKTPVCTPDDDNRRRRAVLLRAQGGIDQVVCVHAGGRHGAPRARREAGRCDSSAPRSPCRSGRRGGTDCDCGGDRAIRAGAGRAGDRGGADRAGRSRRAAATATTFERRRRRRGPSAGERARGAAAPGACRPSAGRGVDRVERAGAKTGAAAGAAFECRRRRRWPSAGGRARGRRPRRRPPLRWTSSGRTKST